MLDEKFVCRTNFIQHHPTSFFTSFTKMLNEMLKQIQHFIHIRIDVGYKYW